MGMRLTDPMKTVLVQTLGRAMRTPQGETVYQVDVYGVARTVTALQRRGLVVMEARQVLDGNGRAHWATTSWLTEEGVKEAQRLAGVKAEARPFDGAQEGLSASAVNDAIKDRRLVKVSEHHGWAAERVGIAMGRTEVGGTVKVGFVNAKGEYTGDFTRVPPSALSLVAEGGNGAQEPEERPTAPVRLVERSEESKGYAAGGGERGCVRRTVRHTYSDGTRVRFDLDAYSDGERVARVTRFAADHTPGMLPTRRRAAWWAPVSPREAQEDGGAQQGAEGAQEAQGAPQGRVWAVGDRVAGEVKGQAFTGRVTNTHFRDGVLDVVHVASDQPLKTPAGRTVHGVMLRGAAEVATLRPGA